MKYLLLDTNVFINLSFDRNDAVKPKELEGLLKLLNSGEMKLILPEIVECEYKRNIEGEFKRAKIDVSQLKNKLEHMVVPTGSDGNGKECTDLKNKLVDTAHQLCGVLKDFNLDDHIMPVKEMLSHRNTKKIKIDNALILEGYRRIIERKAPSHSDDQLNDNIIIETIFKYFKDNPINRSIDKAFFVSFDLSGFADTDKKSIHPDLEIGFSERGLQYSPYLAKVLKEEFNIDEINEEDIKDEEEILATYTPHIQPSDFIEIFPRESVVVQGSTGLSYSDQLSGVVSSVTASISGSSSTWRPRFVNACLDTLIKPTDYDK